MIRTVLASLLCTVALQGCTHSPSQSTSGAALPAPRGSAQYGAFGLDLTTQDRTVKPGNDFFRYADGHWLDTNTIPADRSSWGVFAELDERARADLRQIIEAIPADAVPGSAAQKIRDFYRSYVDTDA